MEILDDNDAKMAFEISLKKTGIVDLGTIIKYVSFWLYLVPDDEHSIHRML